MSSHKIIRALHANLWLNAAGLVISFAATVVLVRTMAPALFAEYSAVIGIVTLATLVFEAGANSGLTRYMSEAERAHARGTFFRRMLFRRWLAAFACGVALIVFGPMYARSTQFSGLAAQPWIFVCVAAIVAAGLVRLLAYYGLLALFETKTALLIQQGFVVLKAVSLAAIALAGGGLVWLVSAVLVLAVVEAGWVNFRLWQHIGAERKPISKAFVNRAQAFGLLTIFDKTCAMLGSGTVLMLVLAPRHPAALIALLALAIDLVGKLVSLTVMPMGNLVAPYFSQTNDDPAAQGLAIARVVKFSSLLYSFSVAAGLLIFPWFIPTVYGGRYSGAVVIAILLLIPTAFENWIRGCCSPALLRNARYRQLMSVNVLQAVATLATLVLIYNQRIEIVIAAVGCVRACVAALNLVALLPLVPPQTFRIPWQGAAIGLGGCAFAYAAGWGLPLPPLPRLLIEGALFAGLFYAGLRCLIFRDPDMLRIAQRILGTRIKFLGRILPTPHIASL
ncbi:MAG: oligosaccharide flippase family protein [Verrucomicrobiota bacterium]